MDPLLTIVADVKVTLSATSPLNAGSLIKTGVKLCLNSSVFVGVNHVQKVGLLTKAFIIALTEMKEKELAGCSDDQKAAVNDRYAHLALVAESGLPAVLETVNEIFSGKLSLKSLAEKPASCLSYFSCVATSAVSVAASVGLVSEKQAADAMSVVKKVEEAPKKVEEVAAKAENVLEQAKAAVPALAPVTDAVSAVVEKVEAAAAPAPEADAPVPEVRPAETTQPSNPVETAPEENKQ